MKTNIYVAGGLVAAAFLVAVIGTEIIRRYALRRGVLDLPNHRSSHTVPTPRGGGVAIVISAIVGLAVGALSGSVRVGDFAIVATGMALLGVIGWLDDHRSLSASFRFLAQTAVGLGLTLYAGGLSTMTMGNHVLSLGLAGVVFGTLGTVWSINLFNFMDGIDGLAGSQSSLFFSGAAALLAWRGDPALATAAAILAGACAGFLPRNWPPAKIFMGDAGSGALGFAIAAMALLSERDGAVPLLALVVLNGVFVADATVTLVRRLARGERPWVAHRSHAYQRLTQFLGSHAPVTVGAFALTIVLFGIATIAVVAPQFAVTAFVVAALLLAVLLVAIERRAPFQG